jgi:ribosome maturation factor RimP
MRLRSEQDKCRNDLPARTQAKGVTDDKNIEAGIEALLAGSGLQLLEFSLSRRGGNVRVKAVIYSASGTGTDECTKAWRLMLPELQLALGVQNPDIEISSPGIDRIIRSAREWKAFIGKPIKILISGEDEWRQAILEGFDGESITCRDRQSRDSQSTVIPTASIAKARLDSSYKGE